VIIMTSRPPADPVSSSLSTSPASLTFSDSNSSSSRAASLRETTKIPSKGPVADARPSRPGLVSRASESSTKTIRPRHHLRNKSSSVVPTLSTANIDKAHSTRQSPTMASHADGKSSGAADLLRQAMMQR
jgi:hypothetical protein